MKPVIKKLNRLANKTEIVLGRERLFSYPRIVQVEPTNRCNQHCVMCPRNDKLDVPIGDMDFESFKKIISQLPALEDLLLNGLGEPLFNKDLLKMIAYASQRKINVAINSNCALVDEALARGLVKSGLALIKISMDSADAQVYQSIRGGSIEPVLNGIRNLAKARKEMNLARPHFWFNSIIMRQNCKELADILLLAKELGVDAVRFKPVDVFDLYQDKGILVEKNELKRNIRKAVSLVKGIRVKHNLNRLLDDFDIYYRPQEKIPCYSPWTELYIQYYGGVRLCCEFYSKKYDVGNILKDDLKKIWNGAEMRQIRKEFKKGNVYFPVCRTCNHFQKNINIYRKIGRLKAFIRN